MVEKNPKPNFLGLSNGPTCASLTPVNPQSPDYFYDFGSLIVWPKFKFTIKIINFDLYYLRKFKKWEKIGSGRKVSLLKLIHINTLTVKV